ncbi:MAG: hypothetical protein IPK71_15990 [Myxococcales bacterium]|nr:hypothetical protein [Myxococcales bacterium]
MSICWGCVVSASSFVSVMGLGQLTSFVANARRARAMRAVDEGAQKDRAPEAPTERAIPTAFVR